MHLGKKLGSRILQKIITEPEVENFFFHLIVLIFFKKEKKMQEAF